MLRPSASALPVLLARLLLVALLVLPPTACRRPAAPPPGGPPPASEPPPTAAPAGTVQNGRFSDAELPLALSIPPGWSARIGAASGGPRVTLTEAGTALVVELIGVPGGGPEPVPREGCAWGFIDTADHALAALPRPLTLATCTPGSSDDPRVFTWGFKAGDVAWHVDATAPPGALDIASAHVAALLADARFTRP